MMNVENSVDLLVDKAKRGQLVLFVGTDAPKELTGRHPTRALAQGLSQSWKQLPANSIISAAEGLQQWQIRAYLAQVLPENVEPGPLFQTIARLPIPFIVTNAVDNLLYDALNEAGREANLLIDDEDIGRRHHGRPELVKVTGDLRRPASLVTSAKQFQLMPDRRRQRLFNLLYAWLAEKSILFVGCDPEAESDFEQYIFPLLARFPTSDDVHAYLVWPKGSTTEQWWANRQVSLINGEPEHLLARMADKLGKTMISFSDDPEMKALRSFLKHLKGANQLSQAEEGQRTVPINQWITSLRVTFGLSLTSKQTLGSTLRVEFFPDIDSYASKSVVDTGISLRRLHGWAKRAESARDAGSVLSGSKWRSVEDSGINFMEAVLPEGSPERQYYLQALYLRQTFADALSVAIELEDDRLSPIPWELLHDGRLAWDNTTLGRGFLGVQYPLYRRPAGLSSPEQVNSRLERALVVAADPTGQLTTLDSEVEWLKETLEKKGRMEVDVRGAGHPDVSRPEAIKALLRDGGYQLLHFSGHGIHVHSDPSQSHLLLGRNRERNKALSAAALAQVARSKALVLVFISACNVGATEESIRGRPWQEAGVVDALARAGVPATVGMRWVVGNKNARSLTETFYTELAKGTPIDQALMIARQAIQKPADQDLVDWANPILTRRHGVLG